MYDIGTSGFLHWQCREAALATLEVWESIAPPLVEWQGSKRSISLRTNLGATPNARYDRTSISFWAGQLGGRTIQIGASTDAVAHEVGHALLDAIRSDLWNFDAYEAYAFHEAFADCVALLVGLSDRRMRETLVSSALLQRPNFLEAIAEDLADALRLESGPNHPHSSPRRALNDFQWKLPMNLRPGGSPSVLSREPHSYSRVLTGCFYDLICNLYAKQQATPAGLERAAHIAGRLLVEAAMNARSVMRFFQEIGRQMIHADNAQNRGENHLAIRNAFASHGIGLGSATLLAPSAGLEGDSPVVDESGTRVRLSPRTRSHLTRRLGAPRNAYLSLAPRRVGDTRVVHATYQRPVLVKDVGIKGVYAKATECVSIGCDHKESILLGETPNTEDVCDEARRFVTSLLERDALLLPARRKGKGDTRAPKRDGRHTHTIRQRGRRKYVTRMRFSCGGGS